MASGILIVIGVHCDKACKEDSKVGQRRFPWVEKLEGWSVGDGFHPGGDIGDGRAMTFQKISSKSSKSLTPRKEGHHETPGLEFSRLFFFLGIEDRSQVSKEGNVNK